MIHSLISTFRNEISGTAAKGYVAEISRFHRIQASPGFRAAAAYAADTLRGFGLEAQTLSYPADGKATFWSMRTFLEWDCKAAVLHLLDDEGKESEKLADYRDQKISIIQRSMPADGEFEVVLLEDGEEHADYEGVDVEGKVVLTSGRVDRVVDLAVRQHGAAGILFDGMMKTAPVRERIDLPDARQYTSFWMPRDERLAVFGFVLTPRQGNALRERCREAAKEGKPPVRVRAKVESSLYSGQIEDVTAVIPGETDEEVVLVAHLCHPQPSANDNASGSGALLEVARALAAQISNGKLPRPRRSIRFLWVPEMTGTYTYLASHEQAIPSMVGGLNLDMVGEDQDKCGSAMLIEATPAALSSFAPFLARYLRDQLLEGAKSHAGQGAFPLFRHGDTPFSGGSDHYIFSDPTVDVPMPMIIQWPDRFYHTSADTIDKVDPAMLALVGVLTASYGYFLASAGERETLWLAHEMNARFKHDVMKAAQAVLAGGLDAEPKSEPGPGLKQEMAYRVGRQSEALTTLRRLAAIDVGPFQADAAAFAETELKRAASFVGEDALEPAHPPSDEWETKAASLIPERRYRGPVSIRDLISRPEDREAFYQFNKKHREFLYTAGTLAVYWADGVRTVARIADMLEMETGARNTEALVTFFEFLGRIGAVELHRKQHAR